MTGFSSIPRHFACAAMTCALILAGSAAVRAADAAAGQAIAEKWCNSCHSIGTDEPRQEDAGPQFAELAKKDAEYLQTAINRPHDFMPDFPSLTSDDKTNVIAYIQSLN